MTVKRQAVPMVTVLTKREVNCCCSDSDFHSDCHQDHIPQQFDDLCHIPMNVHIASNFDDHQMPFAHKLLFETNSKIGVSESKSRHHTSLQQFKQGRAKS
jgi:hypothetical protein